MNTNEIIELDKEYVAHTYGRLSLAPDHGKNATLYDADGKKYIDFTAGIGVNSIGIAPSEWCDAVSAQLSKIQHISKEVCRMLHLCPQMQCLSGKLTSHR